MNLININEWCYANFDLIEEIREKHKKVIVSIAGASSSGKSFCSNMLKDFLISKGLNVLLLSTDDYSIGISKIIFNAVNEKYYNNRLNNSKQIVEIIKQVTTNSTFLEKLNNDNSNLIKRAVSSYFNNSDEVDKFINLLKYELENINFDKVDNYDLLLLSQDINKILKSEDINLKKYSKMSGERTITKSKLKFSDIDIIIVEGIYGLNENLLTNLNNEILITNFIECDNKSLFVRRIIRDINNTTCGKSFIIKNYIEFVAKEYFQNVLPSKQNADIVYQNNISFDELRTGNFLERQEKYSIDKDTADKILKECVLIAKTYEKDTYLFCENENLANVLRLREISYDGKTYLLDSLIHKGQSRLRKDKEIIRPVNIIADKNEIYDIFINKDKLMKSLHSIGINSYKIIKKQRLKLNYFGEIVKLDKVGNKFYIEVNSIEKLKFLCKDNLKKSDPYLDHCISGTNTNFEKDNSISFELDHHQSSFYNAKI